MIMGYRHNEYGDLLLNICALLFERMLIRLNFHYIILVDVIQTLLQMSKLIEAAFDGKGSGASVALVKARYRRNVRTACDEAAVIAAVGR
jgi:hypothetical protein